MKREDAVALALLDTHFHVTTNDPRIADLVRQLWEPFVSPDPAPDAVEVAIEARDGRWRLHAPPEADVIAADPWLLAATLRNGLSRRAIREASSIVPLHAAAVERNGAYVVFSGPPEAGKTTLLLDLLVTGWRLVTDDLVAIEENGLTARPFFKPLSVREPERWRRFVGRWQVPEWLPPPATVGLIPATAFPLAEAVTYAPTLLVFSRFVAGEAGSRESLSPGRTVVLCGDNLHPRDPIGPREVGVLARLGTTTPGAAIRYGSSDQALELVVKCLADAGTME